MLRDDNVTPAYGNRTLFPTFVEGQLDRVFFLQELAEADFASQKSFERLLRRTRNKFGFAGLFGQKPLPTGEARVIASLLLRSAQKAALQAITSYYPATGQKRLVPPESIETITQLLKQLDVIANGLAPNPKLKTLPRAEAELNVAVARSESRVQLPVRSIPTSPLMDSDLQDHYIGRSDEDATKLARQVRHADGTILVTGYRGVGKSTFVNRVIYHTTRYQKDIPKDGWLIVPVTVNLAKVSGVSNILRLTLRSVRNALIDPTTAEPQLIPSFRPETPLPLNRDTEIAPLQEAYARATYKVSMSRANASENKSSVEGSLGLDVSKFVAPITGFQLPSFGLKGSKSRTQTFNRTLSYYDYDENAAEDDLMALIRNLATERPLYEKGPNVRIKLVFIFDELDKMDMVTGLNPMIEGLKNLFLQRYAVFILVTSKMFYYHLQAERAKEDSMLSSYFSAIVSVPLLTFEQARKMVQDWIDWPDGAQIPITIETNLLDQVTRWLVYISYGNPRDIIRELRKMQEWADTTERPYISDRHVSDRSTRSQSLQIFAGIQKCIENVARPEEETRSSPDDNNDVMLVSERLVGDEGRLEQIRRGLYVFTETLIDKGSLSLKPDDLEQLRKDNFSLLTALELEQLAIQLGNDLSLLHNNLPQEVFAPYVRSELFEKVDGTRLQTTADFYRLTKRQMTVTDVPATPSPASNKTAAELIAEAEGLAKQAGWSSRLSAIGHIKQIGSSQISDALASFLLNLSVDKKEPVDHRREAARQLTSEILFKANNLTDIVTAETDDEMLSLFLPLLGKAADEASRQKALDAILALFKTRLTNGFTKILTGKNAENALKVLPGLATQDVLDDVLSWLCGTFQPPEVQEATLATLNLLSEKLGIDQAEKIISNDVYLKYFVKASQFKGPSEKSLQTYVNRGQDYNLLSSFPTLALVAKYQTHLRGLFSSDPLRYARVLLHFDKAEDVTFLLQSLWQLAFDRKNTEFAKTILSELENDESWIKERLVNSLWQTPEFEARILPAIKQAYAQGSYAEETRKKLDARIDELVAAGEKAKKAAAASPGIKQRLESLDSLAKETVELSAALKRPWSSVRPDLSQSTRIAVKRPELGFTLTVVFWIVATLAINVFLYKRDLPPAATLSQAITSRMVLFLADFCIVASVLALSRLIRQETNRISSPIATYSAVSYKTRSSSLNALGSFLPMLAVGLFYVYSEYVGPLNFWNQVFLFLINLIATSALSTYLIKLLPPD